MPLKIRIKPEGKFYLNGGCCKNAGKRPIELVILNGDFMREERFAELEKNSQPLSNEKLSAIVNTISLTPDITKKFAQ